MHNLLLESTTSTLYTHFMASITATCTKCSKQFLIIDQEQAFLKEKNLSLPTMCPPCRQTRRLMLRGNARELFKSKCEKCGKDIIVSFDPAKATSPIFCKQDYEQYLSDHDVLLTDPLPEG